jgi:hypothetical protein
MEISAQSTPRQGHEYDARHVMAEVHLQVGSNEIVSAITGFRRCLEDQGRRRVGRHHQGDGGDPREAVKRDQGLPLRRPPAAQEVAG